LAPLGVMAATAPAETHDSDTGCNIRLKGLKMLSDPQRKLVNLHPKTTTVAAINALPQPHPTPRTRSTSFSRRGSPIPFLRKGTQISYSGQPGRESSRRSNSPTGHHQSESVSLYARVMGARPPDARPGWRIARQLQGAVRD
jgi:hypothetical protein